MAAYNIPDPAAGSVQNQGVLTKFIKQVVDGTPSESNGVLTYKEKWKGPYSTGKEILSSVKTGDTLAQAQAALGSHVEEFSAPTCPTRNNKAGTWKIEGVSVEQIQSGDHCYVTFTFRADYGETDVQTLTEDVEKNVWSITWQAYSVSPWDFCANGGANAKPWSPSYDDSPPTPVWATLADRAAIQAAMNQNPEFKGNFIVYTPDKNVPDCRMYLEAANLEIQKKVGLDRNATYHYPTITHQTVHRGGFNANYEDTATLGEDVDHVHALPSGCPYSFDSSWIWVKTGDNMSQQRDEAENMTIFTRQETFMGVLEDSYDKNYYGNGEFRHTEDGIENGRWERNSI